MCRKWPGDSGQRTGDVELEGRSGDGVGVGGGTKKKVSEGSSRNDPQMEPFRDDESVQEWRGTHVDVANAAREAKDGSVSQG
jgi:hypothetical protein